MKEIDATRLKLKAMELVEGTDLKWWNCIRDPSTKEVYSDEPYFGYAKERDELALGIVEGKPVWEGDELYFSSDDLIEYASTKVTKNNAPLSEGCWSWLPPKQKTAMVELRIEDVEWLANCYGMPAWRSRVAEACSNALQQLKDLK